jgi:hypothetical protein
MIIWGVHLMPAVSRGALYKVRENRYGIGLLTSGEHPIYKSQHKMRRYLAWEGEAVHLGGLSD